MRHENNVVDVAVVADADAEADTDVADADAPTADVYRSRPASAKLFSGSAKNASINRSLSHRTCCSKICAAPASISSNVATAKVVIEPGVFTEFTVTLPRRPPAG
jgi:hypothetical protein